MYKIPGIVDLVLCSKGERQGAVIAAPWKKDERQGTVDLVLWKNIIDRGQKF